MGYTTDFTGKFSFNKKLDAKTYKLLVGLATTRRMARKGLDPKYGVEGEFYFNPKSKEFGQEHEKSIIDFNRPPSTQPSLWLQWVPTDERKHLTWDGSEKFYDYIPWLRYLISTILAPRGYVLNGEVEWQGEDASDIGKIIVTDNIVEARRGRITYD